MIKTEKNKAKISVNKAAAMHATRKDAAATWIKEVVPEHQFIHRCIKRSISGQKYASWFWFSVEESRLGVW